MKEMDTVRLDKILVVDDVTANLQLLTSLLTESGYTVYPASDGELALEFVRSTLPHLILLDIQMPGIDGFEVCRRLKADERTRAIPVIFISILEDEDDKVKGFQAGVVDFITKPFQAEEVLAKVRIHLHLRELTEHLEQKVAERTEALRSANAQLQRELAERKRAEDELSRYRDHLEELVQERTAQLQASNKDLEGFAYSVSHDLRTPLRHISSFMELLQKNAEKVLDEQCRHYMDSICEAARKMGRLIDELLSFSRMGRHAVTLQQLDLGHLVREVIRELEPDAAGRRVDWRIGNLPSVEGDASMLRIVLTNLIANALKFTRPRERARIDIGFQPGQKTETVIYVQDNGVGFDMTDADKLFGVFQRLHREDEFEGTGIGLASVRCIIARHGGRTWADGRPDQGATFYFSMPLKGQNRHSTWQFPGETH